jgi:Tol biopolymer transport system component
VSPDGRSLAYVDSGDVHLLDLAKGVTRPLIRGARPGGTGSLKISPDGRQVAYVSPTGCEVRLVSLGSGPSVLEPDVLYPCGDRFVWLDDWSPDGKQILARTLPAFSNSGYSEKPEEMISIAVSGQAVRLLKRADRAFGAARFSRDGRYIAYDVPTREDPRERDIFLLATDGSGEQPLVESPGTDRVLDWAPDGAGLLFASDRTASLSAYLVRVVDGRPEGPPVLIKQNIEGMVPLGFTRSGSYFYRLDFNSNNVSVATVEPVTSRLLSAPTPANPRSGGVNTAPDWSPDGQHLAFISRPGPITSEVEGEPMLISILSLASGRVRELRPKLTHWPLDNRLRWSPDGGSLLTIASDDREENWGLYRIDTDSGAVAPVLGGWVGFDFDWAADGKAVVYGTEDASGRQSIRLRDLATGADRELYGPVPPSSYNNRVVSPDGRWLAVSVGPSGAWNSGGEALYLVPVSGGSPRELLRVDASSETTARIRNVTWTPDGRHLLFNRLGTGWRISVEGGAPERLDFALTAGRLSPDGRRIAVGSGSGRRSEIWVMENFLPPIKTAR